jgi:hypothetical protein
MKLFHIQFDGQSWYVEAETMRDAITVWATWGAHNAEYDGTEEPDSCALVHDEPVLRA